MKNETKDVQRFDKWSSTYENSWLQKRLFNKVHRTMLTLVESRGGEPGTLVDVGCGTGRLLRAAGERWSSAQLIGVDPAPGMVEVARRLTPGATFYVGAAEALPLPDVSVDYVLSTLSFHHWHDQAAGIREVARILRPGGLFFLADVAAPIWLAWLFRNSRFTSLEQRRTLFAKAGLTVQAQQAVLSRFVVVTIGRCASAQTSNQRKGPAPEQQKDCVGNQSYETESDNPAPVDSMICQVVYEEDAQGHRYGPGGKPG